MNTKFSIKECPTCGEKIAKVKKDWSGLYKEKAYTVCGLSYYECTHCGEKIYDREAIRVIENASPAFQKKRGKRVA